MRVRRVSFRGASKKAHFTSTVARDHCSRAPFRRTHLRAVPSIPGIVLGLVRQGPRHLAVAVRQQIATCLHRWAWPPPFSQGSDTHPSWPPSTLPDPFAPPARAPCRFAEPLPVLLRLLLAVLPTCGSPYSPGPAWSPGHPPAGWCHPGGTPSQLLDQFRWSHPSGLPWAFLLGLPWSPTGSCSWGSSFPPCFLMERCTPPPFAVHVERVPDLLHLPLDALPEALLLRLPQLRAWIQALLARQPRSRSPWVFLHLQLIPHFFHLQVPCVVGLLIGQNGPGVLDGPVFCLNHQPQLIIGLGWRSQGALLVPPLCFCHDLGVEREHREGVHPESLELHVGHSFTGAPQSLRTTRNLLFTWLTSVSTRPLAAWSSPAVMVSNRLCSKGGRSARIYKRSRGNKKRRKQK